MSHYDFRRLGEIVPDGKCDPRAIVPCDKIGLLGFRGLIILEQISKALWKLYFYKETLEHIFGERLKASLFLVKS